MTNTNLLPRSVFLGFEPMFGALDGLLTHAKENYPPHNVVSLDKNKILVEMAVAGFVQEELKVQLKDNMLTVSGEKRSNHDATKYIHRGIAGKAFSKTFRLSEYAEVAGANLKNGILSLTIEVKLPKEREPTSIPIHA
jgi:molecular chaperone IbpA